MCVSETDRDDIFISITTSWCLSQYIRIYQQPQPARALDKMCWNLVNDYRLSKLFLAIACLLTLLQLLAFFSRTSTDLPIFPLRQHKDLGQSRSADRIPPLAHFIYINNWSNDSSMVVDYRRCLETCLSSNPDLNFVLWMDWNVARFLDTFYPSKSRDHRIQRLRSFSVDTTFPITLRSDILRYLILEKFGGIYMDLDTLCQKPMFKRYFEQLRNTMVVGGDPEIQVQIVANSEYLTSNNFLASSPGHPFLKEILKNLQDERIKEKKHAWSITGPLYLSNQLKVFLSLHRLNYTQLALRPEQPEQLIESPIHGGKVAVTNNSLFHPNVDDNNFLKLCTGKESNTSLVYVGCKSLKEYHEWLDAPNGGADSAVLLTVYVHLGWEKKDNLLKKKRFLPFQDFPSLRAWPP